MLYMPAPQTLTLDEVAEQYGCCVIALEALDIQEHGGWIAPESAQQQRRRVEAQKAALNTEIQRLVRKHGLRSEPPLSIPDF